MKRRWTHRLWPWLLAAVVLGLPLYGPAIIDLWVISKYCPQVKFDSALWTSAEIDEGQRIRQYMIRDLVLNVLPGNSREEIEQLLGRSPTHAAMQRHSMRGFDVREKDEQGNWKPCPRTGIGHYYDQFDWDLVYTIGREQIFIHDHKGQEFSPDLEVLLIRLDGDGRFSSWFIDGSTRWPRIVGKQASISFRAER